MNDTHSTVQKQVNTTTSISYRAGTDLTYNRKRGSSQISRTINDIAYIKPEGKYYLAISLSTGITAMNGTPDDAYKDLVFKLFDALSKVVKYPNAQIGRDVSGDLSEESKKGLRMPRDRQLKALIKGIEEFCSVSPAEVHRSLKRIDTNCDREITTSDLEDTVIDVDIFDIIDL